MKKIGIIGCISAIAFFTHCSEPQQNRDNQSNGQTENDSLKSEVEAAIEKQYEKAYYPIPSPEQMFGFINDNGIAYSKKLMNSTELSSEYIQPNTKALNFGVYTADLAYAAAYQDIESTIGLYKVVKRLGAEMNIAEMMTAEMMEKMQANMQNPDSLAIIAGKSYYQAVEYLEQNQQEGKLALMSLGGWIESLYITLNAIDKFEPGTPTANRIADQKITFGNLYTYLKKNEDQLGVSEALSDIKEIRGVFASLVEKRTGKVSKGEDGKLVLGGGRVISITKDQFVKLKEAINNYRSKIITVAV